MFTWITWSVTCDKLIIRQNVHAYLVLTHIEWNKTIPKPTNVDDISAQFFVVAFAQ